MNKKKLKKAGNISHIVNEIIGTYKNNFRTVIKYFIMKLVRSNLNDYDDFELYDFSKIKMIYIIILKKKKKLFLILIILFY